MSGHDYRAGSQDEEEDPEEPLQSWRGWPAEMCDERRKRRIRACLRQTGATMPAWRPATEGDAAAAIDLATRMRMPAEICWRLDLTMTLLMSVAFDDAGAAQRMAELIEQAPLELVDRLGLSTSWRVHSIWLESVAHNARRRSRYGGSRSAS